MAEGRIQDNMVLDSITARGTGTVIQLKPSGFITPEDIAELYRMRGKTVAVQIVDPEQQLPLQYEEEDADEAQTGLALVQ